MSLPGVAKPQVGGGSRFCGRVELSAREYTGNGYLGMSPGSASVDDLGLVEADRSFAVSGTHQRELAARAVPRLLALRDVLPDPVQTCGNTSASAL